MATITRVNTPNLELPYDSLAEFCRKWKIRRLEVFGSALLDRFTNDSDIDLLATYEHDATWSLWDHFAMEDELAAVLGRSVDLVDRAALDQNRNWIRRRSILATAQTIYEE